jgi:hypothetical protein
MAPFLKDELKNGPIDFEYISHTPFQSFSKNDGGTYQAGEITVKARSTGQARKEKIFNVTFYQGFTKRLFTGCLVRAELDGKYVNWTVLPTGEAALDVPTNNSQQVRSERNLEKSSDAQEEKSIAICLQGFAQAFIIQGMSLEDAMANAVKARRMLMLKAVEIHTGIPAPSHSAQLLAETNKIFGSDDQIPLPDKKIVEEDPSDGFGNMSYTDTLQ